MDLQVCCLLGKRKKTIETDFFLFRSCYLRFSSQTYNLRKLHESIHLTNNSVQCKYKNTNRDPALPEYNMWDSDRFKTYLETIGYPNVYKEVIYPGMKECIAGAILIHQDYINTRKNCFELYGADFMLTEDFRPWLIEINSRPALYASTPITAKMCPQVLEDVVKGTLSRRQSKNIQISRFLSVIVDYSRNSHASTGQFELLYREKQHTLPPTDASTLQIRGIPLSHDYFYAPANGADKHATLPIPGNLKQLLPERFSSDFVNINNTKNYMKYVSKQMKKTLTKLLEIIKNERERRRKLRSPRASVGVGRIPQALKPDCVKYVDNINSVNSSLKELQLIFKPRYLSDQKLADIAQTLETTSSGDGLCLSDDCSEEKLISEVDNKREPDARTNNPPPADLPKIDGQNNDVPPESLVTMEATNKDGQLDLKILYEIPSETPEELKKHSQKFEDALSKVPSDKGEESGGLVGDLLKFLNIFQSTRPRPSVPNLGDDFKS